MRQPDIDSVSRADLRVTEGELASELRFDTDDAFPPVYATSRMIALMELAASRVLRPHLENDELSVGVAVEVVHSAATPPGATVTAEARYVRQEGKLYVFEVTAYDNSGEIGRGMHTRAVISTSRLIAGAAKRI
jgi:predicted thioesterase